MVLEAQTGDLNGSPSKARQSPAPHASKEGSLQAPSEQMAVERSPSTGTTAPSELRQNLFMVFITLTQLVQMVPLGVGINSGLALGAAVGASTVESTWVVASYPLTQGAFVLIGGRLGAIYGHKAIFSAGCAWWTIWALAGGYSDNLVSLCIFRALCGIGGGLMIPNIVALLGITFPPGRKRNLGIGLFGAMAPVGAVGGSLIGAIVIQLSRWQWLFLLLGLLGFVVYGAAILIVPADQPIDAGGSVDYVGACIGVAALILFNFAWNQAPVAGWGTPYEIAILIISILLLAAFAFWEAKVATEPILPFNIWKAPSFGALMLATFFAFMSLGIFFWYMNIYMQQVRGDSLITVGLQYLPLTIMGCANAFFAAWLVPRVPAQVIMGMGCLAMVVINVLLATVPARLTYWAMCFPAMFVSAYTIDLITTSAQIVASNTVPARHQGVAGSLVGTLLSYGMSTGLGFAGTVEVHTSDGGRDLLRGYHSAAYLAVGLAGAALLLTIFFVRIPKDTREGWSDPEAGSKGKQEHENPYNR